MTTQAAARPVAPRMSADAGYTSRFECRPEPLFRNLHVQVIDATVRERAVKDLKVFRIPDVFTGRDEIFVGFGTPNAYLVVPNGEGGYQKFAGKSLRRAPSVIEETRDFVQSGILVRFKNLPPHAAEKIREAMKIHHGNKYWTCVNAVLSVMKDAGFTFANSTKSLDSVYLPYTMMKVLLYGGLLFEGKPVEFEVLRTSPVRTENYTWGIIKAELFTFCRHGDRAVQEKAKKSKFWSVLGAVLNAPGRLYGAVKSSLSPAREERRNAPVAPALPEELDYCADINVRVSAASFTGMFLRLFWGPHTLFEAQVEGIKATDYFSKTLQPFPQANPSVATRLKKWILFSRPVIWLIRRVLAPRYDNLGTRSERDIYDMMRTHSEENPNKYNMVIAGLYKNGQCVGTRIILARTTVGLKLVDWIMSKHVLMSGYDYYVFFAGEAWKMVSSTVYLNRNSGTYRPEEADADAAAALVQAIFPHWHVVKEPM
ncbi:MAG: hypothetical protein K2W82_14055 [Candidatus Obscuribacterales bacterium]|nr:hypothetical protein [Candidatus Obscuribacterales bacterium]